MRRFAVSLFKLAPSLILGAAARHSKRSPRRRGWGTRAYYALEDTAPLRLALSDWLEAHPGGRACALTSVGGGVMTALGRLVLDASGGAIVETGHRAGGVSALGGGVGEVAVGLALVQTGALRITPIVGLGGMGIGLRGSSDGDDRRAVSGWGGIFSAVGVAIDLRLHVGPLGLLLGVRLTRRTEGLNLGMGDGAEFHPPAGPYLRFVCAPYRARRT